MQKTSKNGVITVEESKTMFTELNMVDGMQFDRGYLLPTSVRLEIEQIQLLAKWSGIFLGVFLVEGPQNGRFLEKSNAENL
jgi:hypothetical protein